MASTSNLLDVVRHYQRSIEKHGEDEQRVSYYPHWHRHRIPFDPLLTAFLSFKSPIFLTI